MANKVTKICGNCQLCIHTYTGGECSITDNAVEYSQEGCIDHILEDSNYGEDED